MTSTVSQVQNAIYGNKEQIFLLPPHKYFSKLSTSLHIYQHQLSQIFYSNSFSILSQSDNV